MLYKFCVDKGYNQYSSDVEVLTQYVRGVLYGGKDFKPHNVYMLLGEAYIEMYATKNLYP